MDVKNIFIVITPKKIRFFLLTCMAALFLTALITVVIRQGSVYLQTMLTTEPEALSELEKENDQLQAVLSSILPDTNIALFENEFRTVLGWKPGEKNYNFKVYPLQDAIKKGKEIPFQILSEDENYKRPLFDPGWKGFYFRGWLDLSFKNIDARHRLFIFPLGLSARFDFEGNLGLNKSVSIDAHRNINFLVYNYKVKSIKRYNNQLVLSGDPAKAGVQVISLVQDQALPDKVDTQDFIFQLATSKGYELDYLYRNVIRYDYLMEKIKENTVMTSAELEEKDGNLEELFRKNQQLKKELQYFIPLEDKIVPADTCRPIPSELNMKTADIKTALEKGKKLNITTLYQSKQYQRPIYDPDWKENYQKKWAYVPEQVCLNLHRLFVLPMDEEVRKDLLGMLGFKESAKPLKAGEKGFLVYNHSISKAIVHGNQILLLGEPSRTGAQVISLSNTSLDNGKAYIVKLVTPDYAEVDYDIIKSN